MHTNRHPVVQHGFTLIELSMVLVIIALLTGGIFMAQSLIRQSQLRAVATEFDTYRKAIGEFRDKYYGLPGDITTAEGIWGADAGCPGTSSTTVVKTATCNGDGNGSIGSSTSSGLLSNQHEWFRAWQQLSNAGLMNGKFTGAPGDKSLSAALPKVNVPESKLIGAGWTLNFMLLNSNSMLWADQYGHLLNLGAAVEGDYTRGAIMTPDEAVNIDTKIDDGKPGTGIIRAWRTTILSDCTKNDNAQSGAIYNGTFQDRACSLVFLLGY
jgi:prepilin-type N-terminal cleavage/methylation domain-containing protein